MVAVDHGALGREIVQAVGGEANVTSVVHCATRLRFTLADRAKADRDAIKGMPGVVAVVESGGQFQVVIGNAVPRVYAGLPASLTADRDGSSAPKAKTSLFSRAIDVISSIFAPVLGPLAATGILKGLLIIASTTGLLSTQSTTYQVLFATADAFFVFLPVVLAVTSARKFGANPYTAITVAGALLYTNLVNITWMIDGTATPLTMLEYMRAGEAVTFLGIPVLLQVYTSTVFPIIIAVYLQSLVERVANRFIHEAVRNFLTPLIALVVTVPVTLLTIGPAGVWLSSLMASVMTNAYEFSPIVLGLLMGGLWQVLVIFGIHWGIVPLFINNIATVGFDYLKSGAFAAVFSQAGASLGVFLRLRESKTKALSASATLAAMFGVTEPAVYGVTLPRKRVFLIAVISGAIGGAIVGIGAVRMFATGAPGLLTLPIGIDPSGDPANFLWLIAGTAVSFVLATVGTYFFGFSAADRAADAAAAAAEREDSSTDEAEPGLRAPMAGRVIPLAEVRDAAFSSGSMGAGFGLVPTSGRVVAPVSGEVVVAAGHAYGIRGDDGVEVLVHVGIDTVALDGAPFHGPVEVGTRVQAGDRLVDADLDAIRAAGIDDTTIVVVTNAAEFGIAAPVEQDVVEAGAIVVQTSRSAV